jgi:hypothetical protein
MSRSALLLYVWGGVVRQASHQMTRERAEGEAPGRRRRARRRRRCAERRERGRGWGGLQNTYLVSTTCIQLTPFYYGPKKYHTRLFGRCLSPFEDFRSAPPQNDGIHFPKKRSASLGLADLIYNHEHPHFGNNG